MRIPCIIHNLKGYDAHLILNAVKPRHGDIQCIPSNTERYISFTINDVVFIDSCQFMMSSLDKLVDNLAEDKFFQLKRYLESVYRREDNPWTMEINTPADQSDMDEIDVMIQMIENETRSDDGDTTEEMVLNAEDYRNHIYESPELDDDQKEAVHEQFQLMKRKGWVIIF